MIAVVKTGGKQYILKEKAIVRVEKLLGEVGETITFPDVLMVSDEAGKKVTVGTPVVEGVSVSGTIVKQGRTRTTNVVKYKNKTRYKRTIGHRQYFTEVKIDTIK